MVNKFWKFLHTGANDWIRSNLPFDLARIYLTSDKTVRRNFAKQLLPDLKFVDVLISHVSVEEALQVIFDAGEGFIKPINGSNSVGCFELRRSGGGLISPVLGKKSISSWASYLSKDGKLWMVEKILDIKNEVKIHIFAPRALNAIIIRREWVKNGKPIRHNIEVDRDGNVINTLKKHLPKEAKDFLENKLTEIPANFKDFIDVADRFGSLIEVPFIRLDIYDTEDGMYFSEITRRPLLFKYINKETTKKYFDYWNESAKWLKEGKCLTK